MKNRKECTYNLFLDVSHSLFKGTHFRKPKSVLPPYKIVLVRHGESQWNKLNKFCGWFDADLSSQGIAEAKFAGEQLREKGFK